jgi:hypothetical protein
MCAEYFQKNNIYQTGTVMKKGTQFGAFNLGDKEFQERGMGGNSKCRRELYF